MIGFGSDTWCVDTLQPGKLARGKYLLAQALYHRLSTPRGMLRGGEEERVYGLDVAGIVGSIGYEYALAALQGMITAELSKDDRVSDVLVRVARSTASNGEISLVISVDVTPYDETEDFTFTMRSTDLTLEFLAFQLPEAA